MQYIAWRCQSSRTNLSECLSCNVIKKTHIEGRVSSIRPRITGEGFKSNKTSVATQSAAEAKNIRGCARAGIVLGFGDLSFGSVAGARRQKNFGVSVAVSAAVVPVTCARRRRR